MWDIIKKHPVAVVAAIFAHVIIIGALFFKFDFFPDFTDSKVNDIEFVPVKIVQAKTIDEKTLQARKDKKQRDAERKKEAARKARDAKLKAQREKEQKKKREQAKKQKAVEKKRLAELKKKRKADKKKKEELKKKEEVRKQKEEKRKQEEKRKEDEAQAELDLKNKMEADRASRAEAASRREKEVSKYERLIRTAVERHWKVPSAANKNLKYVVQVRIIPSGDVIDVIAIQSSGDAAFDKSVENAVYRASPLPVPAAETGYFEHFRKIIFEFSPRNRL